MRNKGLFLTNINYLTLSRPLANFVFIGMTKEPITVLYFEFLLDSNNSNALLKSTSGLKLNQIL